MLGRSDVQQALSSDRRAGWSARRAVRENHRRVLRQQWRPLASAAAVLIVVTITAAAFTPGDQARGFVLGSGLTATACALAACVVLLSGTAPLMMGELAEQWTAQELRPLTEHGWRLVNHYGLSKGDHDHVLVGPGGVVLLESKWSAHEWELTDRDHFFQAALDQTARNAKQLAAWHDIARHGRPHVEPVLVLWGQARRKIVERPPTRHDRSGVLVTAGDHVQAWALRHSRAALTPTQVDEVWDSLVKHAGRRDAIEHRSQPMPRSLTSWLLIALSCVVAALTGFVGTGQALRALNSNLLLWLLAGSLGLGVLEGVRRRAPFPWQIRALQLGILSMYLLAGVVVAFAYATS